MVEMAYTAGGGEVPKVCVDAIDHLEMRWPGASFHGARTALAIAVVDALPFEIQTRVRYIYDDTLSYHVGTFHDPVMGSSPEEAAAYPWMMQKCIAWVEERKVYETPWEPIGEDDYTDG